MKANNAQTKAIVVGTSIVPSCGGMPKTMRKFAKVLNGRIYSFTSGKFGQEEMEAFPEVSHIETHSNAMLDWYGWSPRSRRLKGEQYAQGADLISCHVMLRYHAHWVRELARKNDLPYWFVPHGQLDPWVYTYRAGIKHLWLNLFGRRFMAEAAHVIFSTEQERKKAAWFYEGANTRVVHWPVDLIDVESKERHRDALRRKYSIPATARVLLYLGRLHSMKRPLETIDAISQIGKERPYLLLIGPDGDVTAQECRARAEARGIANSVIAPGPIYGQEKETALLGADAFVSLSKRENFGHTAAEALAAGTPVILSPGNDLAPELQPLDCGFFMPDEEAETVQNSMRSFMGASNASLRQMGANGRQFVAEKLGFELFRQRLLDLADEAKALHQK